MFQIVFSFYLDYIFDDIYCNDDIINNIKELPNSIITPESYQQDYNTIIKPLIDKSLQINVLLF